MSADFAARMAADKFVAGCGIELVESAPGRAVARVTVATRHLNGADVAQGGLIFTLADFAFAAAVNAHGPLALGVNASIAYHKIAVTGDVLRAEARELSQGRSLGSYLVEVRNQRDEAIATFTGTAYRPKSG